MQSRPSGAFPAVTPSLRAPSDEMPIPVATPPAPSGLRPPSERGEETGLDIGRLPRAGDSFDGYTIVDLIGQGNMGRIYRARDRLGRDVAIKVILTEVASEEGLARFQREGQAMASVPRHKYVIGVHSAGAIGGRPYLVLDYVLGESLEAVLKRGPLPVVQAVLVAEKLARALDHVHGAGVLHRDMKPANVLIRSSDGEPILTDFGLAGLRGADTLTKTGDVIGTPLYMAPEQVLGLHKEVDGRADVWAVGVLLYEMATGTLPFPGATMLEVLEAVTAREPRPIHELCDDADENLSALVSRILAKDKRERIPSPGALAASLRAWRKAYEGGTAPPPLPMLPRRRRQLALAGLAGLAVLAVLLAGVALAVAGRGEGAASGPTPEASDGPGPAAASSEALAAIDAACAAATAGDAAALEVAINEPALSAAELEVRAKLQRVMDMTMLSARREFEARPPRFGPTGRMVRLAGSVQRLVPERRWQTGFPTQVVDWLTKQDKVLDNAELLELLESLGDSGFLVSPRSLLNLLDHLTLAESAGAQRPAEYYRVLVACTKLGAPLDCSTHFHVDARGIPARLPEASPASALVWLRIQLLNRREEQSQALSDQFMSVLDRLEPVNQLEAFRFALERLIVVDGLAATRKRVEDALERAPDAPLGRVVLVDLLHRHAQQRARQHDRAGTERALEDAWQAAEKALDTVKRVSREGDASDAWHALCWRVSAKALMARLALQPNARVEELRSMLPKPDARARAEEDGRKLRRALEAELGSGN
ncbi:MAG: protein kinase [Planctomycetota bacterium]